MFKHNELAIHQVL